MSDILENNYKVFFGNALERLKELPDNSIDSIITDAPYGLSNLTTELVNKTISEWVNGNDAFVPDGKGFMGKEWDASVPPPAIWKECFRVLKPGGYLLSFFGTRTQDLGGLAIRLAGFEIRDTISWIYGSGFPKSMNISKAINKSAGVEYKAKKASGVGFMNNNNDGYNNTINQLEQVGESTDEAEKWEGWGTAIKPAVEPIIVARKPISEKTVANNVIKWGTGGLNIDASRIGYNTDYDKKHQEDIRKETGTFFGENGVSKSEQVKMQGRFPANLILGHSEECIEVGVKEETYTNHNAPKGTFAGGEQDRGSDTSEYRKNVVYTTVYECVNGCPVKTLDEQSGVRKGGTYPTKRGNSSNTTFASGQETEGGKRAMGDISGASRFFYIPKASKKDRNEGLEDLQGQTIGEKGNGLGRVCENCGSSIMNPCKCENRTFINPVRQNFHPTVKPTTLMEYLIKLTTQEGGTVLDPFTGSGSTGKAALLNGFKFIGVELTEEYLPIIEKRLKFAQNEYNKKQETLNETLFNIEE